MMVSQSNESRILFTSKTFLLEVNHEDLQTLVVNDDLLANNVHSNGGDNLLLIENGEITAMSDTKKSNIFT